MDFYNTVYRPLEYCTCIEVFLAELKMYLYFIHALDLRVLLVNICDPMWENPVFEEIFYFSMLSL